MIYKTTLSLDHNKLLKCLDIQLNNPTNQYTIKVPKVKPTNKKTLKTSVINSPISPPSSLGETKGESLDNIKYTLYKNTHKYIKRDKIKSSFGSTEGPKALANKIKMAKRMSIYIQFYEEQKVPALSKSIFVCG